jgi:PAS domain S-box-containing protein
MCNPTQCRYLAQASHLVFSLAANGVVRGANPDVTKTLGYDLAHLVRKSLSNLAPPDQRRRIGRVLERCRTDRTVWEELVLVAADGQQVPLLCCFQRMATPGDRGTLLLTGIRTDALSDDSQVDAAAVLGRLTFRCHGPAHRLMQSIEAVLMQYPWCEAAERSRSELDRLLETLSVSVSLPQAGAAPESAKPIDVVRTIEAALRLVDGDPAYKNIEVQLRPDRPSIWTSAHPVGLVFITLHLVRNARDATVGRKSGRLLIDIFLTEQEVVLEFKDNGTGLEPETLGSVFTPIFKAAAAGNGHTGLGLATCSELIHHMGGRIRMQSVPSKGTTVVVSLPAAPPAKSSL